MSDRPEDWEYFQDLYRFAFVLVRDAGRAKRVVTEALDEALKKRRGDGDPDRVMTLLFRDVRQRALKEVAARSGRAKAGELPPNAEEALTARDAESIQEALHGLPEPGRTALTLLYLDVLEVEAIQKMLGVGPAELAELLQGARLELHAAGGGVVES